MYHTFAGLSFVLWSHQCRPVILSLALSLGYCLTPLCPRETCGKGFIAPCDLSQENPTEWRQTACAKFKGKVNWPPPSEFFLCIGFSVGAVYCERRNSLLLMCIVLFAASQKKYWELHCAVAPVSDNILVLRKKNTSELLSTKVKMRFQKWAVAFPWAGVLSDNRKLVEVRSRNLSRPAECGNVPDESNKCGPYTRLSLK